MTRVVYTVYIELPADEISSDREHYRWDHPTISKFKRTAIEFQTHFSSLLKRQEKFAAHCGASFLNFGRDRQFEDFSCNLRSSVPLTTYQVINFYKIFLLEALARSYDEVLYLDFDVVPLNYANIFEAYDFHRGMCVRSQTPSDKNRHATSDRDPISKYRCTRTLLARRGISLEPEVMNTGVVGIHSLHAKELNYFGDDFLQLCQLSAEHGFSINNEAILSYRACERGIDIQWLSDTWHHIYDSRAVGRLNRNANLVHVINKRFGDLWNE